VRSSLPLRCRLRPPSILSPSAKFGARPEQGFWRPLINSVGTSPSGVRGTSPNGVRGASPSDADGDGAKTSDADDATTNDADGDASTSAGDADGACDIGSNASGDGDTARRR